MYTSYIEDKPAYESSTLKVYEYTIFADNQTDAVQDGEVTVHNDGCGGIAHVYIAGETDQDFVLDAMEDADIAATRARFDGPMAAVRAGVAVQVAAWESWYAEGEETRAAEAERIAEEQKHSCSLCGAPGIRAEWQSPDDALRLCVACYATPGGQEMRGRFTR
jgi:hypothetical protein